MNMDKKTLFCHSEPPQAAKNLVFIGAKRPFACVSG
jgi:hypothetical protein